MKNLNTMSTSQLSVYLHLWMEISALFSKLFPNWEFADVTMSNKLPWNCKGTFISELINKGQAEVNLSDKKGSYIRTFKVVVNKGFIVESIFEMESDPWNPEADLDDDYYYHQDINWKKVY